MDLQRKKELLYEWNNRHPEMGVIAIVCKETGDAFLTISKDTSVGFNRHRFQLPANMHPNKALQALWGGWLCLYGSESIGIQGSAGGLH